MDFTDIYHSINRLPFIDSQKTCSIIQKLQQRLIENRIDLNTVFEFCKRVSKEIKQQNISDKAVDVEKSRQLLVELIKKEIEKFLQLIGE